MIDIDVWLIWRDKKLFPNILEKKWYWIISPWYRHDPSDPVHHLVLGAPVEEMCKHILCEKLNDKNSYNNHYPYSVEYICWDQFGIEIWIIGFYDVYGVSTSQNIFYFLLDAM